MVDSLVVVAPTPDPARVDPLLQFILVVAGQQDNPRDRELGPIHLLKYAYLADLAHAEASGGETYTGADWRFHHFGPWSPAVLDRIDPALAAVSVERKVLQSSKYDDFVRYSLQDERLLDLLDARLPGPVVSAVRSAVREFASDTASLLRHVYLTRPMLQAAPGEMLVFEAAARAAQPAELSELATARDGATFGLLVAEPPTESTPRLSWKARKEKREAFLRRREEIRRHLAQETARRPLPPSPPPRYDDVYFEGVKLLDELAGPPPSPLHGEAVFSADIWKAPSRRDPDVP